VSERVRIIGIGSPVSGDTLGIEAVQWLCQEAAWRGRDGIDWVVLERPGAALLHYFSGVETLCLIDALDEGDIPGHPAAAVRRIEAEELLSQAGALSSHDFGVAEALLLAERLALLPPRLILYGIPPSRSPLDGGWRCELSKLLMADLYPENRA
jgi:hydrogenase maturation protease